MTRAAVPSHNIRHDRPDQRFSHPPAQREQGPPRGVLSPHSTLKEGIAAILKAEGYIPDHRGADAQGHKTLVVKMKYLDGAPAITGLVRASTPGRRLYYATPTFRASSTASASASFRPPRA